MIHGIINVYKEKGFTSHDVVAKLRGIVGQKKIGHTGTLDPDATGVLPVCLGKATKLCDLLTDKDKTYEAIMLLGMTTDTQDITGRILEEKSTETLTADKVREVIESFIGDYDQIPPMYSALKVNGKKLYELAREGKVVERKARPVKILDIRIIEMDLPRVRMEVSCSKGPYIRTLCHDIGEQLGCGGCMESLIRTRWYNPFPKIRSTERPDAAAASVLEGSVVVICDNTPEVMILPTSIFDFLQETDDYYFPPFTGSYLRILRQFVFFAAMLITPLWYLLVSNPEILHGRWRFLIPADPGEVPLIVQLFLIEFTIDGLKLASLNTPSMLSNSFSVVGGLLLGDFAVKAGWLCPEVIVYMAFVSIANFAQPSYELGYAFKYMRMLLLFATWLFGVWGFFGGIVLGLILVASNKTINGERSYLYPLIPFNASALGRLFLRRLKPICTKESEK